MIKILSAVTAIYIFITFCLTIIFQNSFMPMLFGDNALAGIIKLGLISGLVYIARRHNFRYRLSVQLLGILGVMVTAFGLAGIASVDLEYLTYPSLMSMDYIAMAEIGVILCLASLTYSYESSELAIRKPLINWQFAQLRLQRTQQRLANLLVDDMPNKRVTSLSRRHSRLAS